MCVEKGALGPVTVDFDDGIVWAETEFVNSDMLRVMCHRLGLITSLGLILDSDIPEVWQYIGKSFRVELKRWGRKGAPKDRNYNSLAAQIASQITQAAAKNGTDTRGAVRAYESLIRHYIPYEIDILVIYQRDNSSMTARKANARPFFMPTSLHPKLAKAMLNLVKVTEGTVLDPFCGTGGNIIEGSLMGLKVIGVEMDGDVAYGARKNMEHFCTNGNWCVIHADSTKSPLRDESVDAIATDLPYGRSSMMPEELRTLYLKGLREIKRVLKVGAYACVVSPIPLDNLLPTGLIKEKEIKLMVHRSLTRHFSCLQKVHL